MMALARGLLFLSLVGLTGAASVRLVLLRYDPVEDRLERFMVLTAVLGLGAMLLLAVGQFTAFRDPFAPWLEDLLLLFSTSWGTIWMAAAAGFLVLTVLLLWQGPRVPVLLLPLLLALYPPFAGHAAGTEGWAPATLVADWLHVVAAGSWLGALAALLYLGRGMTEHPLLHALARFSVQARWSVTALVLTGGFASWIHLPTPQALLLEPWGRVLVVKLVLVMAMMALGARNWRTLTPDIGTPEGDAALVRASRGEALLGILVLAVTAVLTGTSPPPS